MEAKTLIESNGSHWMGEEPDSIEELLRTLAEYPLDSTFEDYGNFYYRLKRSDFLKPDSEYAIEWDGAMKFFGNFATISHVFNINTFDEELISILTKAIDDNKKRPDYEHIQRGLGPAFPREVESKPISFEI